MGILLGQLWGGDRGRSQNQVVRTMALSVFLALRSTSIPFTGLGHTRTGSPSYTQSCKDPKWGNNESNLGSEYLNFG